MNWNERYALLLLDDDNHEEYQVSEVKWSGNNKWPPDENDCPTVELLECNTLCYSTVTLFFMVAQVWLKVFHDRAHSVTCER